MRKFELNDQQMERIIELKRRGFTWMGIQRDIMIDRRIVKRVFTEWEQSQSVEELKEARQKLAIEEFNRHQVSTFHFNRQFVTHLDFPRADYVKYDADGYMDIFLNKSLGNGEDSKYFNGEEKDPKRLNRQIRRRNEWLFRSLREHTAKDVDWNVFENWKDSWNNCVRHVPQMETEAQTFVDSLPAQRERRRKMSEYDSLMDQQAIKKLIEGYVVNTWQNIVEVEVTSAKGELKNTDRIPELTTDAAGMKFFEYIMDAIPKKLKHTKTLKSAIGEAVKTRQTVMELEEMLDPVRLRPIFARTRCFLCPI